MRLIFKTSILSSIFLCALAASANTMARADLPFNFVIKGHSFPAGSYDVVMDSTQSFITLVNQTNLADRFVFTLGPADEAIAPATLRFDVCGGQTFLRDIHMGEKITGELDHRGRPGNEACTGLGAVSTITAKTQEGPAGHHS